MLVSVLCGVELFGFVGALLAIPAAGIIQVVVSEVYDWRRGELKMTLATPAGTEAKEADRRRVRAMFLSRWSGGGRHTGDRTAAPVEATRPE